MHCVFFVLWLSGFVALPAVYDDPVITVFSLASAVMRVIGNIYKLFTIIGGRQMRNLSNIIKKKLTAGVEMLLVVGNMGEAIVYPLPSNEVLVYSPAKYSSTLYNYPSHIWWGGFYCIYTSLPVEVTHHMNVRWYQYKEVPFLRPFSSKPAELERPPFKLLQ